MTNEQILSELDNMLKFIRGGVKLSELTLSMIVDLLKTNDSTVRDKVVDVIEAIFNSNNSYDLKQVMSWDDVDKLPLAIRKRIYIVALKDADVKLERVFNFPEDEIKDLLLAYGNNYRVDDTIWNKILDWKNRALANEWMLALVPNRTLSEAILKKLFSSFMIDRVAILKNIHGQQTLYESTQTNIVKFFEHADAKEILMKYWYSSIFNSVWLMIVDEFEEADIRDLMLTHIGRGHSLGNDVFEKLIEKFSPENETVNEIALKHVEKFCPDRALARVFYKLSETSRQKMLEFLDKYPGNRYSYEDKTGARTALSCGW